jgi:hypothetical protein
MRAWRIRTHSLRIAIIGAVLIVIIIFLLAVVFLFIFFLFWLLAKEDTGSCHRSGAAGILGFAFVPVELPLETHLSIGSPPEGAHRNFKLLAAKCADSDCRGGAQPFNDSKAALDHGRLFLGESDLLIVAFWMTLAQDRSLNLAVIGRH